MAAAHDQVSSVIIMQVPVGRILGLRHAVLRAQLPVETAHFDGDEAPGTIHVAAVLAEEVIGCASFMRRDFSGEAAFQLRGMAIATAFRRCGMGHRLLDFAEELLRDEPVRLRWCNARQSAIPFYEKEGWTVVSDLFEIPTAGLHRRMTRRL